MEAIMARKKKLYTQNDIKHFENLPPEQQKQDLFNKINDTIEKRFKQEVINSFYRGYVFAYSLIKEKFADKYVVATSEEEKESLISDLLKSVDEMKEDIQKSKELEKAYEDSKDKEEDK